MKKNILTMLGIVLLLAASAFAAMFHTADFINGSVLTVYNGTGDTAVTWVLDDAGTYGTNRTVYPRGASAAVAAYSTNATTGEIYTPTQIANSWPSEPSTNRLLSINYTTDATFTNTFALWITRSIDGTNFDKSQNIWIATIPGQTTIAQTDTVITNAPPEFLVGARAFRLWKIVGGANPSDNGYIQINSLTLGGFEVSP